MRIFLRNLIMAIMLALFFICYLSSLAEVAKEVTPDRQARVIIVQIIKEIFLGAVLCVLLTLLGAMKFNLNDIFLCTCLVLFAKSVR